MNSQPRICVLHIGCPKTGSTSIQSWLSQNKDCIYRSGVYVPKFTGVCGHEQLARLSLDYDGNKIKASKYYGELKRELEQAACGLETVLFSSEHLQALMYENIKSLKNILCSLNFVDFRIVLYIRDQADAALSMYSTWVKNGYAGQISEFLDLDYLVSVYDHEQTISRWSSVFGEQAILVRLFPTSLYYSADIIDDFAEQCGLSARHANLISVTAQNEKLSLECLQFLRKLNSRNYYWWLFPVLPRRHLIDFLIRIGSNYASYSLSAKHIYRIRSQFQFSNETVRAKYFPNRKSLFCSPVTCPALNKDEVIQDSDFTRRADAEELRRIESIVLVNPAEISYGKVLFLAYVKLKYSLSLFRLKVVSMFNTFLLKVPGWGH